jgi:hypothetical protein
MSVENELQAKDRHLEDLRAELRSKQKQVIFLRGLLQAVGLNVPVDKEPDFDLKTPSRGQLLVKGRFAKAAAIWSNNKSDSNLPSLPSITGPQSDGNGFEGVRTNQRGAKKGPKRREIRKSNTT